MLNKRGQKAGLVTGLIFGIASLVIGLIVAFVITSTLTTSGLLSDARITATTTNESDNSGNIVFLNQTGYTLANANSTTTGFAITAIWGSYNQTVTQASITNLPAGYNVSIASGNYSLSSTGLIRNATSTYVFPNVSVSYTWQPFATEEFVVNGTTGNFSTGVNNISTKLPTILLVAAIVLLLGVLAILIGVWNRMKFGGQL